MLVKLTHPEPNFELWIETSEIIVMERYNRPESLIIQRLDENPIVTAIVLKNGRTMSCKETPEEIMQLINNYV